jgi:hypothetical protein
VVRDAGGVRDPRRAHGDKLRGAMGETLRFLVNKHASTGASPVVSNRNVQLKKASARDTSESRKQLVRQNEGRSLARRASISAESATLKRASVRFRARGRQFVVHPTLARSAHSWNKGSVS